MNNHINTPPAKCSFKSLFLGAFILFASIAPCVLRAKALIWDLGYTLFKPNKQYVFGQLGGLDAMRMFFRYGTSCSRIMSTTLFDLLEKGKSQDKNNFACDGEILDEKYRPHDPSGRLLPCLMCDWFAGKCSCAEVLEKVADSGDSYDKFLSVPHRRLSEKTLSWMFNPASFAQSMVPAPGAVRLLKECSRVKDACGCKKHDMFVLSNWDAESFELLYENKSNKRRIFNYFKPENLFISGLIGDIKPHPSIFKYLLEQSGLKPDDCVFIDDQIDNIVVARELGIHTVHLQNGNYHQARLELKKLGVLPTCVRAGRNKK